MLWFFGSRRKITIAWYLGSRAKGVFEEVVENIVRTVFYLLMMKTDNSSVDLATWDPHGCGKKDFHSMMDIKTYME